MSQKIKMVLVAILSLVLVFIIVGFVGILKNRKAQEEKLLQNSLEKTKNVDDVQNQGDIDAQAQGAQEFLEKNQAPNQTSEEKQATLEKQRADAEAFLKKNENTKQTPEEKKAALEKQRLEAQEFLKTTNK